TLPPELPGGKAGLIGIRNPQATSYGIAPGFGKRTQGARLWRSLPAATCPAAAMTQPVGHRWRARADPLLVPAPKQRWRALHRRFLPRPRRRDARRDRPAGRNDGPARLRGGARVVRREPLPGLPLPAWPVGRDGRGALRIRPQ